MAVYRCLHCEKKEPKDWTHNNLNYVTFTDDQRFDPEVKCCHCGRGGLVCHHNGSYFDKAKQCFICHDCGEECGGEGLARLRQFARTGAVPELLNLLDVTDH